MSTMVEVELGTGTLVSRAAAGEREAWVRLIDRFSGMVLSVARAGGLNSTDAADVSQTVWLRLLEHLPRIEDPDRVAGWLATTTQRESQRFRRNARRDVLVEDDGALEPRWPAAGPDSAILALESDRRLAAACARLPTRYRQMVALLLGDEPPTYKELSAALDMPHGSIGPTRMRCLESLRRLYEGSGERD